MYTGAIPSDFPEPRVPRKTAGAARWAPPRVRAMDWHAWHDRYDRDDHPFTRRLVTVRERILEELDRLPAGPVRIVSVCAGQGRDVIGALAGHPRAGDVSARLVELDPQNAEHARVAAAAAGLERVEVVCGDAADTSRYAGAVPADIALVCGLFGNITDDDVLRTVDHCTQLVREGGAVVWTRHRGAPDLFPQICAWFEERGFTRDWLTAPDVRYGVAVHRSTTPARPLAEDTTLFSFVGYDILRA